MQQPEVIVQPGVEVWAARGAWRSWWTLTDEARRCREQLGLPIDRPVIASGHQAAFWHAGILAKHLAMSCFAERRGWAPAWVVVDQDPEDFAEVRVPAYDQGGDSLTAVHVPVAPERVAQALRAGVPPCMIEPFDPPVIRTHAWATQRVGQGLEAIVGALATAKADARSAAEQVAHAVSALIGNPSRTVNVMATALASTDLFAALVDRMRNDPAGCVNAYNAAVSALPQAKLSLLATDPGRQRYELPLWAIDAATGLRRRVWSDMLGDVRGFRLAPRALMLTAVLRLGACDVFVHGLGGGASAVGETSEEPGRTAAHSTGALGGYDRATEVWVRSWLGRELCRSVVVSATLRLPLVRGDIVSEDQVARARWLAHASLHNPGLVGDGPAQARKLELVGAIATARDRSAKRSQFRALHAELERARAVVGAEANRLSVHAEDLAHRWASQAVAMDRTWAFALHSAQGLETLKAAVARAVE